MLKLYGFFQNCSHQAKNWATSPSNDSTPREAHQIIERFLEGRGLDPYEWRDFVDYEAIDDTVEQARLEICAILTAHCMSGGSLRSRRDEKDS